MATLVIHDIKANPVRISVSLNGVRHLLEYSDKQAALDAMRDNLPDTETQIELALLLALREWRKTDTNLTNLAGLVGKTITVAAPKVTIT